MIVFVAGSRIEIVEPNPATLKKYGLSLNDWKEMLACQGYVCPICLKIPSSGRFVIDHVHVQNYKNMKPEKKKLWVRGICCHYCNRFYLSKGITIIKAQLIKEYLIDFEKRRPR